MPEQQIEAAIAAVREQSATQLRELLRVASSAVLQKIAVDIVPSLVRIGSYTGEPAGSGEHYADALARPRVSGLPAILVRVHRGPFEGADAKTLFDALKETGAAQAAIAVIGDRPQAIEQHLGTLAKWVFDLDGLVNLLLNADVGVTLRTYEARYVDPSYFR
jgi:restriction endonuclease Mrr